MKSRANWRGQSTNVEIGTSIFYYTGTIYQLGTDLVLSTSDYSSYAALFASGTVPTINEGVSKSDGTASIQVLNHLQSSLNLNPGEIEVRVQCVNRVLDYPAENFLMQCSVEVWSTKEFVSASRQFVDFNSTGFGGGLLGVPEQSFTLTGGNPGDRSANGTLQEGNGLYKLNFNINLPNLPAVSSPRTVYISAIVRPTRVASASDVVIPQLP